MIALSPDRVPTLETPRLILRGHRPSDLAAVTAIWSDPEVVRQITGTPSSAEDSWARMLRYAGLWGLLGFGFWAVEEKASGGFIGDVGLADFKREVAPPPLKQMLGEAPEAGWVLAPWAHGKGYATEAMRAALAWSDATLARPIVCIMAPDNVASQRVAEKCGFVKQAEGTYKTWPTVLYRREPAGR